MRLATALAFALLALPPLVAATEYYEFVPSMSCRHVRTGTGFEGNPIYSTYCRNAKWTPASLDLRAGDVVTQEQGTATDYYGNKICPPRRWLSGTQEVKCWYPKEPGSSDPGVIVAYLTVTGPSASITTAPAPDARVQGTLEFAGTATDPKGLDRVEWRIRPSYSSGGTWRLAADGPATTLPWTATVDTLPLDRTTYYFEVRAVADDGLVASRSTRFVVDNPAWYDHRIDRIEGAGFATGDPSLRVYFTTTSNAFSVGYHLKMEAFRNGAWSTFYEKSETDHGGGLWADMKWTEGNSWEYGRYPIRATIDPEDVVAERNESNNVKETYVWRWFDAEEQGDVRDLPNDPHVPT